MITIIHGEDITKSRNYFLELKQQHADALVFDGSSLTLTDLTQNLEGTSLFADTKTFFIEDFFSKRKESKETQAIMAFLTSHEDNTIIFWESKELTAKQLHNFPRITNKLFKIPATVFAFLDSLFPGNAKQSIEFFRQTLTDQEEQFILFMLSRHIRMLLAILTSNQTPTISEAARVAPWQKSKLEQQAKRLGKEKLLQFHTKLYELDLAQKTGKLIGNLQTALEEFLIQTDI